MSLGLSCLRGRKYVAARSPQAQAVPGYPVWHGGLGSWELWEGPALSTGASMRSPKVPRHQRRSKSDGLGWQEGHLGKGLSVPGTSSSRAQGAHPLGRLVCSVA